MSVPHLIALFTRTCLRVAQVKLVTGFGRIAYLRAFFNVIPSYSLFHRPLLDMPDPFPSFCFTPPQTTPNSLLLTGIRRPPCAPPPAGMLVGHLAESSLVLPKTQSTMPFGATVEYHPITAKDKARLHQFGKKVCPGIFYGICAICGRKLEERHAGSRRKRITRTSRPRSLRATGQCERSFRREIRRQVLFSMCKWIDKVGRKRFRSSHIQSNSASIGKRLILGVFWKHYTWTLSVDIMFTNCKNMGSWRTHRVPFRFQLDTTSCSPRPSASKHPLRPTVGSRIQYTHAFPTHVST